MAIKFNSANLILVSDIKQVNRLIFGLSLLGLMVSSYLAYEYSLAGSIACPVGGRGCDIVRQSEYSSFFGISTPLYGVAFYLGVAVWSAVRSYNIDNILLKRLQFLGVVLGVSVGLYLTYLEAFVIGAYCFWCLVSFATSVVILVLSALSLR